MNILIAGANGLVGGRLSSFLSRKGFNITKLSRKKKKGFKKIDWRSDQQIIKACRGQDVIIN